MSAQFTERQRRKLYARIDALAQKSTAFNERVIYRAQHPAVSEQPVCRLCGNTRLYRSSRCAASCGKRAKLYSYALINVRINSLL